MKKLFLAVVIVLGLALAASTFYYVTSSQDKNPLTTGPKSSQSELASTQGELAARNQALSSTQTEPGAARDTLASIRSELGTTRDTFTSTRLVFDPANQTLNSKLAELNSANEQMTAAQKSLMTLQALTPKTQQQLATAQETLEGLGITISASTECWDVELIDNPAAKNPTLKELSAFLAKDRTENHAYIINAYDCSQFSRDLHNNAEAAGIRAAEVQLTFQNETISHALNAFITTDYGLVYVDCTTAPDTIARVKSGKEYRAINVGLVAGVNVRNDSWWDSLSTYYYSPGSTGGHVITSQIRIYW
jgi:peptidoglycan hydrolase CwlO-like protein